MQIKVLQGINLENGITTIKIKCDQKPKTELLDLVKSFHPVFMKNYTIEENTIAIQSKLPHLWKESATALNKQATNEWTDDEAKDYILNTVIKNQIKSMSTIPLLHATHELGYETIQFYMTEGIKKKPGALYNRYYKMGVGAQGEITVSASSSKDSYLSVKTQRDKWLTNKLLERLCIPMAKWQVIEKKEDLDKLFEEYPKPFIIKPVGLMGGSGVTTNITTLEKAYQAWDTAKEPINKKKRPSWQRKVMIQEQVQSQAGEDYRLLVIDGEMEIATKRIPAFVIGNGKHNIEELIEETNKDPKRNLEDPTHTLKPIKIDKSLKNYLKTQKLTLDYVPKKDEHIRVRLPASMSQGGITEDMTDKVHPQTKLIVESFAKSTKAFCLGVDVMCLDISKPLTPENGTILEVNTMPEAYLNFYPVKGNAYDHVATTYIKKLLKGNPSVRKVVVLNTSDLDGEEVTKLVRKRCGHTPDKKLGLYKNNKIFINGNMLNKNLDTWKAIESLKINGSLEVIALAYDKIEEVEEYGLGFDKINTLIIRGKLSEKYKRLINKYEEDGLITKIISIP